MKGIPVDDLIYMLRVAFSSAPYSVVTKDFLVKLMDVYGDDYFKDPGYIHFSVSNGRKHSDSDDEIS